MKIPAQALLVFCSALSFAQNSGNAPQAIQPTPTDQHEIKDIYHVVQVDEFEVKKGVQFPSEYLSTLQKEITKQLTDAKIFQTVFEAGQHPANGDAPVLHLSGTIHNYKQGSRKKRYVMGRLAGSSEIDAEVVFLDGATHQKLVIQELRGELTGGFFGGSEDNASQELARQVVIQTKLMLERRVPAAPAEAVAVTSSDAKADSSSGAVDRQVLTISAKDWTESERKLDQQAAASYRVVGVSLTGRFTADLELEKNATSSGTYQYRMVHPRLATHLQGAITKAAEEGFSVAPHTLNVLGNCVTVIMEKSPDPNQARYQYRVTEPLLMSSAKKDTEKYQGEGYTLLDETEFGSIHVLLFQKAAGEK